MLGKKREKPSYGYGLNVQSTYNKPEKYTTYGKNAQSGKPISDKKRKEKF